jgi:hypothetical protein
MICKECGLPMPICNALAMYRTAMEALQRGDMADARKWAAEAKAEHDRYLSARDAP